MDDRDQSGRGGLLGRLLGRGVQVCDLYQGDLRDSVRVTVEAKAVVAGDVIAPRVVVCGLVKGRVLTKKLVLMPGGEVWGDVWADDLRQRPGAALRGWVSPLTPPLLAVLESGGSIPEHPGPDASKRLAGVTHGASLEALRAELVEANLARQALEREMAAWKAGAPAGTTKREPGEAIEIAVLQEGQKRLEADLRASQQRERTLSRALQSAQEQGESLQSTVAELEEALKVMTARRDEAIAGNLEHERAIVSLKDALENRQQRIARLIDDLAKANQLGGERWRQVQVLESQLDESRSELQSLVDDLREQLAASQQKVRERDLLLDDLGDNLVQSQAHVEQQHWELVRVREQLASLEKTGPESENRAEEALAAQKRAEEALSRQEAEILRLGAELDVALAESDHDRAELAQVKAHWEEQANKVAELQARLADEAGAERALGQVQEQLDQVRHLAESRASQLSEMQAQLEQYQQRQARREAELLAAGEQAGLLEKALEKERSRSAGLEKELQNARAGVLAIQEEAERRAAHFRQALDLSQEQLAQAQTRLDREQTDYAEAQAQMAAWRVETERLEGELTAMNESQEELQTELNLARSIIAQLNQDIAELEDRLAERDKTVARLYADLADLRAEMPGASHLESLCQDQATRIEELQQEVVSGQSELQRREQQLADLLAWVERSGALQPWREQSKPPTSLESPSMSEP